MKTADPAWPDRPTCWPLVLTMIETCQYLRLDVTNKDPEMAARSLRKLVLNDAFPGPFRVRGRRLFLRAEIEEWCSRLAREIVGGEREDTETAERVCEPLDDATPADTILAT